MRIAAQANNLWTEKKMLIVLVLFTSIFWTLRLSYWNAVVEKPFSDMADLDRVAHGVSASWTFDSGPFWRTWTTPTLVTARAVQIVLFGDTLTAWRFFQATLTFTASLWLAYEVYLISGSRFLALALLFFIALSKPSIFWSLKFAREGFHEMLVYAVSAGFFRAMRTRSPITCVVLGVLTAALFLNRANSLPLVPIAALFIGAGFWPRPQAGHRTNWRPTIIAVLAFATGIAMLWTPWIIRSVNLYGEPVFLNTQGPYAWLWELGEITVTLEDGTTVTTDEEKLQQEAPNQFSTDLAASRYASSVGLAWVRDNVSKLPYLTLRRIARTVHVRIIHLTKVSREDLYHNFIDRLLIDKTSFTVISGFFGLLLLGRLYRWELLFLFAAVNVPWLSAALLIGEPRMLEPAIPLILFGNIAWFTLLYRATADYRARLASRWTPSA